MTEFQRIETLFQAACELPIEERAAYLARECADEPELERRVVAMLAEHDSGESLGMPVEALADVSAPTEGPGTVIERYKLLQQIGEGGFGVVYMAEQEHPVRRKVALKVIKLGMDTREVVARFEAERQALAMMDHPNIAKVLDGGATSTGRPYFVMELVRGISITEYADRNVLSTEDRLALFMQVCAAVQHAHQKGVIHRDLKPSNVLVTMNDGAPMPKVIDFGIAKAMHTRLTEKTLFTQFQRFIGTPAYMSPEQAELSALDVDTRTDIYSLGVLLYELLTGTVPFDPQTLVEGGLSEIQRVIREEPPERPSLRISTSGDAGTASARGASDIHGLSRLLRGDLDWIVMKCLEKERGRRYSTANELASDLQRHLDSVPVVAGPPSRWYRLRKFVARNKTGVLSGGLVLTALVGGMIATGFAMREASLQRDDALVAQQDAVEQRNHALEVTSFLLDTLELTDRGETLNPDVEVRHVLDRASELIRDSFTDQPWAEARVRSTIARAYETLAEDELAEAHYRRAIEAYAQIEYEPLEYFRALWGLTHLCFNLERPDAFTMAERARVVAIEAIGVEHPELAAELERFTDQVKEGTMAMQEDVMRQVPAAFERAAAAADRGLEPGDPLNIVVSDLYAWCGFAMWYGPWEELSIPVWRKTLEIRRRELSPGHPGLARTLTQLVTVLSRAGRGDEAEREIADSLDRLRILLGSENTHVAMLEGMLGQALVQQERFAEAEPLLVHSCETLAAQLPITSFLLVDALGRVVELYASSGDEASAAPYRARIATALEHGALMMPWPIASQAFGREYAPMLAAAAVVREHVGGEAYFAEPIADGPVVAKAVDELLQRGAELVPSEGPLATTFARYVAYWEGGLKPGQLDPQKARMIDAALAVLEPASASFPIEVAELRARRAQLVARRGAPEEARELARAAWRTLRDSATRPDWFTTQAKVRVADCLTEQELYPEAEEILLPAYEVLEVQLGPRHSLTLDLRALIAEMYVGWGRPADADRYLPDPDPSTSAPR